VISG